MDANQAREEHKKVFTSRQRQYKEVFVERFNNGEDVDKLIHTPLLFTMRGYKKNANKRTREFREKLISYGIL